MAGSSECGPRWTPHPSVARVHHQGISISIEPILAPWMCRSFILVWSSRYSFYKAWSALLQVNEMQVNEMQYRSLVFYRVHSWLQEVTCGDGREIPSAESKESAYYLSAICWAWRISLIGTIRVPVYACLSRERITALSGWVKLFTARVDKGCDGQWKCVRRDWAQTTDVIYLKGPPYSKRQV